MTIKIPVGLDNFRKIREDGWYYVDKTAFISKLLSQPFEANLITRPRRFGKTLTISMMEDFFDISRDSKSHFAGLEIYNDTALCDEWMNKWPVLSVTLKDVEGLDFDDAYGMLRILISEVCKKYAFLGESNLVDSDDRLIFNELKAQQAEKGNIKSSLLLLTRMMNAHFGKQVILLVDEYDVPLAKASEHGYYEEMLDVIRALLGKAMKTNPYLKFAVVTGCLRISKESIFTGINNFATDSITGDAFNEYIGFTQAEVHQLLGDADLLSHEAEIKEWYDGYRFGNVDVYCPWAVLNYVNALQNNPSAEPESYWANTSHNGIIYHYISKKLKNVRDNFDTLMDGDYIITPIEKNLTYDYITSSSKNFWSLLYLTGYLTIAELSDSSLKLPKGNMALRIPNREVREIFKKNILEWFDDYVVKIDRSQICDALWRGDIDTAQRLLSALLMKTVSYYDYQESFYHAFLAGLFAGDEYEVESNNEYGVGRPDVVIKDVDNQRVLVIEVKYAKTQNDIPMKFREAQRQFVDRKYLEGIPDGYAEKIGYCAVFFAKKCFLEKATE